MIFEYVVKVRKVNIYEYKLIGIIGLWFMKEILEIFNRNLEFCVYCDKNWLGKSFVFF